MTVMQEDNFMNTDWLILVVAGYVVYKIGWVDGFTPVNLFLILCLVIAGGAMFLRRSAYGKTLKAKRDAQVKEYEERKKKE